MEIQEIQGVYPKDLYNQIETTSYSDAIEFGLTFRTVLNYYQNEEEKTRREQWCYKFIKCAIDEITTMHKRNNEISEEEKDYFVKNFLRRYKDYTLADIKLFANMVCSCEIGDGLKAVDIGAINEKLAGYNQMRNIQLADYFARTDREEQKARDIECEHEDYEARYELTKLKLRAFDSVKDEFMLYVQQYYDSIGYIFDGELLPSRIPNFVQAIEEYLEKKPNKAWIEYKEQREKFGIAPKGVQTEFNFTDIF